MIYCTMRSKFYYTNSKNNQASTIQNAKLFPAKKVGENDARQAREKRGATEITAMGGKVSTKGPGRSLCTRRGRFYAQKSSKVS